MTLKTSFFNKGIYKSTLKRYMWGAILYFALLFLVTVMSVLSRLSSGRLDYEINFLSEYIPVPIIISLFVPTVAALLVFRFLHSKPQAIFTYSIPVSRRSGFVSSILGGFTLMFLPVFLIGVILLLMSLSGFDIFFTPYDCFAWIGYNTLSLFMMFSCAVFSVSITGNAFAAIIINILIHSVLAMLVGASENVADLFLYGYTSDNAVMDIISENNFVVSATGFSSEYFRDNMTLWRFAVYICSSLILYALSYFIVLKRKIDTVSEVAGFKWLNSVFKYGITFVVAMFAIGVMSYDIEDSPTTVFATVLILALITYLACEMVTKKTLNVISSWKGFVVFTAVFSVFVCLFACTSFFGYETRIPDADDVVEVMFDDNSSLFGDEKFSSDKKVIENVINAHSHIISDMPFLDEYIDSYNQTAVSIVYKLKNGKSLNRRYDITEEAFVSVMNMLYENREFKELMEPVFLENSEIVDVDMLDYHVDFDKEEILGALRKDVLNLNYESIKNLSGSSHYPLIIRYFEKSKEEWDNGETVVRTYEMQINSSFENTSEYIKNAIESYRAKQVK